MVIKAAINGFGRIGRLLFRAATERKADIDFVAVNDLAPAKTLAHFLKNDSVHGHVPFDVKAEPDKIIVDGKPIKVLSERDPGQLPWSDLGVYLTVESTGLFREREKAALHLKAGARKVLISAPAKNPDITVVLGVNHEQYDHGNHNIISNASCTTNCVSPVAKVLNDNFGLQKALMTTAHAYTNDQRILDLVHKDLRRGRAGALSIIPTTTGAAVAAGLVLPELSGRMNGLALRVPVPNVSIVDLTVLLEKNATAEEINTAFKNVAEGSLKGIMGYSEEPLVSTDYNHDPHSATIDAMSTMVIGGNLAKVLAWYDNEWGFSCRMVELIEIIGKKAGL